MPKITQRKKLVKRLKSWKYANGPTRMALLEWPYNILVENFSQILQYYHTGASLN